MTPTHCRCLVHVDLRGARMQKRKRRGIARSPTRKGMARRWTVGSARLIRGRRRSLRESGGGSEGASWSEIRDGVKGQRVGRGVACAPGSRLEGSTSWSCPWCWQVGEGRRTFCLSSGVLVPVTLRGRRAEQKSPLRRGVDGDGCELRGLISRSRIVCSGEMSE